MNQWLYAHGWEIVSLLVGFLLGARIYACGLFKRRTYKYGSGYGINRYVRKWKVLGFTVWTRSFVK